MVDLFYCLLSLGCNMNNNYCVYKHTSPSGKVYIGITCMKPETRWANGKGYRTQMFYRAIQKYGWQNFEHQILFNGLSKDEAERKEVELISLYQSNDGEHGYNVDNGGCSCGSHSEATRKKLSVNMIGDKRNKGRVHTEEARINMSKAHKGKRLDESAKRKISEFNKGKKHKLESIERMREVKRKLSSYPVYCVELDKVFNSVPEAVEYINEIGGTVIRQGIQKVVNGIMNTSGKLSDGTKIHWEKAE